MQTNDKYWIELFVLDSNNSNHLTLETKAIRLCKQISSNSYKNEIIDKLISFIPYVRGVFNKFPDLFYTGI